MEHAALPAPRALPVSRLSYSAIAGYERCSYRFYLQRALRLPGGSALLIDESYNANRASMAAAIALLGQAAVGNQGRRIAVLGDMLELGAQGSALHRGLAAPVQAAGVDLVFCSGPLMHALWEALPSSRRGGYGGSVTRFPHPGVLIARPKARSARRRPAGFQRGPRRLPAAHSRRRPEGRHHRRADSDQHE